MATFYFSAFADEAGNSLKEQIAALRENGIGFIEPRNVDGKVIIDMTETEWSDIHRRLNDSGIAVGSLGSPIGKYPIHDDFAPHFDRFKRALDCCRALETKRMRMFSFFVEPNERAACRAEVIDRLGKMLEEAKKAGVTLCHENESHIYGQMPAEVSDLLTSLPDLRGIHDPANFVLNGADPMEGIRSTLIRPEYLHIKDADLTENVILPAGEGKGKIAETLNLVNEKVDGPVMLTIEPHLAIFDAFKNLSADQIHNKYQFPSHRAAFDCAVHSLENLLTQNGFGKDAYFTWKK